MACEAKVALQVEQLSVTLDQSLILQNIDFQFCSGEVTAVIGPNGAGKSTLLSACMGDITTSQGRVLLQTKTLQDWPYEARARVLAALPQQHPLNFPFSVEQVVALGRTPHDSSASHNRMVVKAVLGAMDIAHLQHKNYLHLSGGERQRTQIARILCQIWDHNHDESRVLFLDEPTAALDISHQKQLMLLLNKLKRHSLAVVMVLHDLNLVSRYSDKVLALKDGQLFQSGDTKTVMQKSSLESLFDTQFSVVHHPEADDLIISL